MSVFEERGRLDEQVQDARRKAWLVRAGIAGLGFLAAWFFFGGRR